MPYPVLTETAARAPAYLSQLATRLVVPDEADIQRLHDLNTAFPEQPADASEVLRILDHFASPATVASAGGRYFGFVTGGTLPQALAASWMVSA